MLSQQENDLELFDSNQTNLLAVNRSSSEWKAPEVNNKYRISTFFTTFKRAKSLNQTQKFSRQNTMKYDQDQESILQSLFTEIGLRKQREQSALPTIFSKNFRQCCKKIPVLNPKSKPLILWRLLILVQIIYMCFETPIYMVFGQEFWTQVLPQAITTGVLYITLLMFLIDVILEFITAYYYQGNLVTSKSEIAINYFRGNFPTDILAIISILIRLIIRDDTYRYLQILFYFKLPGLNKIYQEFSEMFLLKKSTRALIGVFRILLTLFFGFVVYGCCFLAIGHWAVENQMNSWLLNPGNFGMIIERPIQQQFFFGVYFAIGTLTSTMGFGDIQPLNLYECTFGVLGILFSVIIFFISVSFMFKIIDEHSNYDFLVHRSQVAIGMFMKEKEVPNETCIKVKQYLNDHWAQEHSRDHNLEKEIIDSLAPQLREELMYDSYGAFLQSSDVFANNFSKPFLKTLSLKIQETSYSKGDQIFIDRQNDLQDSHEIYFINYGSVLIYPDLGRCNSDENYLKKLTSKQTFGEYSFFTGRSRLASAKANSYTQVFYIKREDFLQTLKSFPDDYETYCFIREKVLHNSDYQALGGVCWTCGAYDHYSTNCNVSHYVPQTNLYKAESNEFCDQTRLKFKRSKPIQRWNSLNHLPQLTNIMQVGTAKKRELIKSYHQMQQSTDQTENQDQKSLVQNLPTTDDVQLSSRQNLIRRYAKQQFIHQGLVNFDVPRNFKRYFPLNNPNQIRNNQSSHFVVDAD